MQVELFDVEATAKFPTTRYQGSKSKFVDWIWYCIKDLKFNSVLDSFGGTGSVAYKMKQQGKTVTYNDILKFNFIIGKALIENNSERVDDLDLKLILHKDPTINYPSLIKDTFYDIYFTEEENEWLDITITNIKKLSNEYKQSIAFFALFQACIIKRPYNLFHRKNLYIRTQDVKRSFGNKVTWDKSFESHFKNFIKEANNAIFSNGKINKSINKNVIEIESKYDLIYIDTPYISQKGVGLDYLDFYHFLEGVVNYENWENSINYNTKHKRLKLNGSNWTKCDKIENSFQELIRHYKESILVISYRSDGIPSIKRIKEILIENGKNVTIFESKEMKYVLSKKQSSEVLIVGE